MVGGSIEGTDDSQLSHYIALSDSLLKVQMPQQFVLTTIFFKPIQYPPDILKLVHCCSLLFAVSVFCLYYLFL